MMKTGMPAISSTELVATTRWTKLLWFSQATYSNSSAAEPPSSTATKSQVMKVFFTKMRIILLLQNGCCVTDTWRMSVVWAPRIDNGSQHFCWHVSVFLVVCFTLADSWINTSKGVSKTNHMCSHDTGSGALACCTASSGGSLVYGIAA